MQLDIVTNKEIAQRLRCSTSKASRLVRLYRDSLALKKYTPIEWGRFCEFLGIEANPR